MTSFTGLGHEEALGRARALVPALRERAARDESLRQMSKETLNDLHRTGLFRFHQPKHWGGAELPFTAIFDRSIRNSCAVLKIDSSACCQVLKHPLSFSIALTFAFSPSGVMVTTFTRRSVACG